VAWQDEITPDQWEEWQQYARKISKSKKVNTTLGPEDYAATAIEKLLMQENRPDNVEGWLALTIKNQYIDRFRKIQARGGASMRELTDQEWEFEMVSQAIGSPSGIIYNKESVNEVLAVLSDKEKEILILAAAGFDNHQIALYLNFKTNKIVATRLGQIQQKVKTKVEKISPNVY
jgi:DNA-directed RNA polymerase specialized sigma24 family protein